MSNDNFLVSLKKARSYGLHEFLEIVGELSQESTKKGLIGRKCKELITLGIALQKQCNRCIKIHHAESVKLGATAEEISLVNRIVLFLKASPGPGELWSHWEDSWREFALARAALEHHHRELIALGIALVRQQPEHISLHASAALGFGATPEQVFEVMPIALLMDGAPALSQIPHLVQALEPPLAATA
ncbi:MAG: carboxymuconolactone decarboxylase family protein [Thiotrichales bacterium]